MAQDRKLTKNEKRRLREKDHKASAVGVNTGNGKENVVNSSGSSSNGSGGSSGSSSNSSSSSSSSSRKEEKGLDIEIEYVSADYLDDADTDPAMVEQFKEIFDKFTKP